MLKIKYIIFFVTFASMIFFIRIFLGSLRYSYPISALAIFSHSWVFVEAPSKDNIFNFIIGMITVTPHLNNITNLMNIQKVSS